MPYMYGPASQWTNMHGPGADSAELVLYIIINMYICASVIVGIGNYIASNIAGWLAGRQ